MVLTNTPKLCQLSRIDTYFFIITNKSQKKTVSRIFDPNFVFEPTFWLARFWTVVSLTHTFEKMIFLLKLFAETMKS